TGLMSTLAASVSLVMLAARALAEPADVALDAALPAPLAACVTAAQLSASYQRALAANGISGSPRQLRVAVTNRPGIQRGTTLLQIVATDAGRPLGTRELPVSTGDCAALPEALGLVLALLTLEPEPVSVAPATQPTAAATTAPQPLETKPSRRPARPRVSTPGAHVALGVSASAVFGVLSSVAPALQLQAATPGDRLSLRLKAGLLWPQERAIEEGFIATRSYELALELCAGWPWPGWPQLWLRLCGGPRIGVMLARGRGFEIANLSNTEYLVHLGLTPELAFRLARATWLQCGAGASLAVARPVFRVAIEGGQRILELPYPQAVRAELGLSIVQIF
ncbi:MAG: hypothetical protein ABW321_22315, partial [Polyangiales bacterium]